MHSMFRQKSFQDEKAKLYLVATPIGNLSEMTPRAIEILKSVDLIACEDTRTSGQLLKYFDIHNQLMSYQNFNEEKKAQEILALLEEGKNIALISDAGYPLLNDPGQKVVSLLANHGYSVVPISGANAMVNGLVASGLIAQPFTFIGFLPSNQSDARKKLEVYQKFPTTLVFYEAPHRIEKMLHTLLDVLGNRSMCLARELTKVHEEFIRGTISEVLEIAPTLKGEMVVIVEGYQEQEQPIDQSLIHQMVQEAVLQGMSTKDAIKKVSSQMKIAKNKVYQIVHGVEN